VSPCPFARFRVAKTLADSASIIAFLRALEHYDGILFLTTNRVGAFDDAFISRIHVKLYYEDFTSEERQKVWQTFMDKLARDRGDSLRLNIDAKEYLRSSTVKAIKWNGREIRNGKSRQLQCNAGVTDPPR
jgi:hypothetical protein